MSKKTVQFIATGLVMMLFGITMVVIGTINNYLTVELNADKLVIGLCASVLAFGILAGTFAFGPIADRYGYKPVMLSGVLMIIAGIAGIIFSQNMGPVPYLFFCIGFGGGMINGITNVIVADIYPKNSSAWLSLLGVFYGVGALGFPLFTSVLLKNGLTYQTILTLASFILLIPFILVLALKFPQAKHSGNIPFRVYLNFFTRPAILLFGFFLFFQSAVESIIPVWVPTFLAEIYSAGYDQALYAITISAIGLTVMRLVLSHILKIWSPLLILFLSVVAIFAGLLVLQFGHSFYLGLAGVGLAGMGMAASFPVILSYTAKYFPANAGTAFSLVIGIGLIGNITLNAFTGFMLNTYGIDKLNYILITFILLMLILLKIIHVKLLKNRNYVSKTMA